MPFLAIILIELAEHIPLKQGLRLSLAVNADLILAELAEHIPLKQGLRPFAASAAAAALALAEHIPLKQGLRHKFVFSCFSFLPNSQSIFH